jgi:integrase
MTEFMILTAARLREAADAEWSEIDIGAATWTVPASRSKMSRDHFVPLSDAALRVIAQQAAVRSSDKYIFPGRFNTPIATSTAGPALTKIGVGFTRHGWRSVCRDAMADRLDIDGETAEFVLGHVKGGVEGAYRHETALAKRRVAMERYADWLNGVEPASNVIPFAKAAAE